MGRAGLFSAGDTNLIWYSFDIHNILCLAAPRDEFYHVYVCWRLCVLCNNILATPSAYTDMETDSLYSFTDISPGYFEHNCSQLDPICWSLTLRKCHGWCVVCYLCYLCYRGFSPRAQVSADHLFDAEKSGINLDPRSVSRGESWCHSHMPLYPISNCPFSFRIDFHFV